MNVTDSRSLDRVVKLGKCEAGFCDGEAVAEISLDTLEFDAVTLESRAKIKAVKVCMRHKSWYFKYQEELLDRINPERKKNAKAKSARPQTNLDHSGPIAKRFQSIPR